MSIFTPDFLLKKIQNTDEFDILKIQIAFVPETLFFQLVSNFWHSGQMHEDKDVFYSKNTASVEFRSLRNIYDDPYQKKRKK